MGWIRDFRFVMKTNYQSLRERFEDPERVLHQLIVDMEEELDRIKGSVAEAIADELQLRRQVERAEEESVRWRARAEVALEREDDELARRALERKLLAETRGEKLRAEYERHRDQTRTLRDAVQDLEEKIRQARHQRTILLARLVRAESGRKIDAALRSGGGTSAFAKFRDLERRVERSEALCEAFGQMEGTEFEAEDLEEQFGREEMKERLERELEQLRLRITKDE